ncbi:methionyl-tRNA formyltransferase [Candidatus Kaiserbacteria bacterium CG10_big_fil_rev_8_21_14_0_10_56_12]|uniref:methionyl-tRNA formyltransferase n=1 Tax=Candidatus Kaiserbacteria bacterium CG10_big_fil_rev_8_21_14_0_10_56_12 TaxID=1974611 RepID=A0A2H0UBL3_9BACT|nr:MAG: methionyl-tRNA formyltransferase [Candidatus Kaiserbacteria bacterium CG10_big_fil_rev_8_21_14_0_10_56_12]
MTKTVNKFVFFGTPQVASDTLSTLLEHGYTPSLVVTAPDAPRGRGLVLTPSPVKELAIAHDLPCVTPERLDDCAIAAIAATQCTYGICVAYGKIFPEALIDTFTLGVLNVHYSLLPRHRGATPLEAALLAGDAVTGVTVQKMVKALDAGDVIAQREISIGEEETARDLRPRLIALGASLLVDTLPNYLDGTANAVAQDATRATHSGKLKKEDGLLDLDAPACENWNKYRAYADTIGTYVLQDGKRIKIVTASLTNGKFVIGRVVPEGKREMDYHDVVSRR